MAKHESTDTSKIEKCPECGAPNFEGYGGESGKSRIAYRCANQKWGFYFHF